MLTAEENLESSKGASGKRRRGRPKAKVPGLTKSATMELLMQVQTGKVSLVELRRPALHGEAVKLFIANEVRLLAEVAKAAGLSDMGDLFENIHLALLESLAQTA